MKKSAIVVFVERYDAQWSSPTIAQIKLCEKFDDWRRRHEGVEIVCTSYGEEYFPDNSCSNSDGYGIIKMTVVYLEKGE